MKIDKIHFFSKLIEELITIRYCSYQTKFLIAEREKININNSLENGFFVDNAVISNYYKSVNCLKKNLRSINDLTIAHNNLNLEIDACGIRHKNLFIGPRGNMFSFKPPHYEKLQFMLQEWLREDNLQGNSLDILMSYFKLLHIHPFSDGNGRLARAYLYSKSSTLSQVAVFVHATKGKGHNHLVRNAFTKSFSEDLFIYYKTFLSWQCSFQRLLLTFTGEHIGSLELALRSKLSKDKRPLRKSAKFIEAFTTINSFIRMVELEMDKISIPQEGNHSLGKVGHC